MNKILYKYDGPVLDSNGKVRKNNWEEYIHAYSKEQAIYILQTRYKKQFALTSRAYIKLKIKYLEECKI